MFRSFLGILLSFSILIAKSQHNELSKITFHSEFEKASFEKFFIEKDENYFDLFLSVSPEVDIAFSVSSRQQYQNFRENIRKGVEARNSTKKLKYLFKQAHSEFFTKYELNNYFHEIFQNGRYNCVSASALYAMLFRDFEISYIIKEAPTHVFLVAFPETEQVLVETTDPVKGFYSFDFSFKNSFVNYLKDSKLISDEDMVEMTTSQIFDKYFFKNEQVSLRELIGLQYYNSGIYYLQKENFIEAYQEFQKAYLFYPSDRILYSLLASAAAYIEKSNKKEDKVLVKLIADLSELPEDKLQTKHLTAEFANLTIKHLTEQYNPEYYDEIYYSLSSSVQRESLKQEIDFIYNYERSRILLNRGSYKSSMEFAEKAYQLRPDNVDAENLLILNIQQRLRISGGSEKTENMMKDFGEKYPNLKDNDGFIILMLQVLLANMSTYYEVNKAGDGEVARSGFEKLMEQKKEIEVDESLIAIAYSRAASYYFKKGNYSKSKLLINKGLQFAPENHELRRRLTILGNY